MSQLRAQVAKALGLPFNASLAEVVAAAAAVRARSEATAGEMVQVATDARLILRSQRRWAEDYARRDLGGFAEFLKGQRQHAFLTAGAELSYLVRERMQAKAESFAVAMAAVVAQSPELADAYDTERRA